MTVLTGEICCQLPPQEMHYLRLLNDLRVHGVCVCYRLSAQAINLSRTFLGCNVIELVLSLHQFSLLPITMQHVCVILHADCFIPAFS